MDDSKSSILMRCTCSHCSYDENNMKQVAARGISQIQRKKHSKTLAQKSWIGVKPNFHCTSEHFRRNLISILYDQLPIFHTLGLRKAIFSQSKADQIQLCSIFRIFSVGMLFISIQFDKQQSHIYKCLQKSWSLLGHSKDWKKKSVQRRSTCKRRCSSQRSRPYWFNFLNSICLTLELPDFSECCDLKRINNTHDNCLKACRKSLVCYCKSWTLLCWFAAPISWVHCFWRCGTCKGLE